MGCDLPVCRGTIASHTFFMGAYLTAKITLRQIPFQTGWS
jgi:hypothetical protein